MRIFDKKDVDTRDKRCDNIVIDIVKSFDNDDVWNHKDFISEPTSPANTRSASSSTVNSVSSDGKSNNGYSGNVDGNTNPYDALPVKWQRKTGGNDTSSERFPCSVCPATFGRLPDQQRHEYRFHSTKRQSYKCGYCPIKRLSETSILNHLASAHKGKKKSYKTAKAFQWRPSTFLSAKAWPKKSELRPNDDDQNDNPALNVAVDEIVKDADKDT